MRYFTIKAGTRVWRTVQTAAPAMTNLEAAGANAPTWEGSYTEKQVTYDESDRLDVVSYNSKWGKKLSEDFYYFHLPIGYFFRVIEVTIPNVTITEHDTPS